MERPRRGRPRHPDVLTPAEWRVLEQLREGTGTALAAAVASPGDDRQQLLNDQFLANIHSTDQPKTPPDARIPRMNPEQEHQAAAVENYRTAADLVGTLALLGPLERDRKHAIHAGLFLRLRSLMQSVLCLTEGIGHGEAMLALTRLVMETTITIRYLVIHGNEEMYDRFVIYGLRDEVAVLDDIQRRIDERKTGELPIERMIKLGIERQLLDSDVTEDTARSIHGSWGPNYYDRMQGLVGGPDPYLYLQRILSAAVHGDWSNLLRFHLEKRSGGYMPAYNRSGEEQKGLLDPSAGMVCDAAIAYARKYRPGAHSLIRSLEDCIDAVRSAAHETGDFEI